MSATKDSHTILTTDGDTSGNAIRVSFTELNKKASHLSSIITSLVPVASGYKCVMPTCIMYIVKAQ